jgi:ribosomal-protein-alanine N-acetyltransferase
MRLPHLVCPLALDVSVRPLVEADGQGPYLDWINDPAVTRWLLAQFDRRLVAEDLVAYIRACEDHPDELLLGVIDRETDTHVGNLKLMGFDARHAMCSISLVLAPTAKPGTGRQVIAMGCSIAFDALGIHRIGAGGFGENVASIEAFSRAGFSKEGLSRDRYLVNGRRHDCWYAGLLVTDPPVFRDFLVLPAAMKQSS